MVGLSSSSCEMGGNLADGRQAASTKSPLERGRGGLLVDAGQHYSLAVEVAEVVSGFSEK